MFFTIGMTLLVVLGILAIIAITVYAILNFIDDINNVL